jgi:hypothetical protein
MKRLAFCLLAIFTTIQVRSQDMVSDLDSSDDFQIVSASDVATIYVDPKDHWLVVHAAGMLQ